MKNGYNIHKTPITGNLIEDTKYFKDIFKDDDNTIFRLFRNKNSSINCCIIFENHIVDKEMINENIIQPIMKSYLYKDTDNKIDFLMNKVVINCDVRISCDEEEIINSMLYGDTIIFCDGSYGAMIANTKDWKVRNIKEPEGESVVRGSREGFNESIDTNISLIRRKINSPELKFKYKEVGKITKTKICICYIDNLVSKQILEDLNSRLDKIKIDGILESGYIEEKIKDHPHSIFHTIGNTERPDVVAAKLLEGRIALICDGTPSVLTIPFIFTEYFQSSEDYNNNFVYGSFNRILRISGFILATSVPAVYVALVTFHQELIPRELLLSIASSRKGVPFPTIIEAILMITVFEILREAGTRLPKNIGQAISIVGALVLGEAAVSAGFVSAPMVIVVSITAISKFSVPKMAVVIMVIKNIFLLLAGFLGLYGYIYGMIGLSLYLFSMKSFGVEYMLKVGSINKEDLKDLGIRVPWEFMKNKSKFIIGKTDSDEEGR
ncbi:spore germination protein [Clostridium ganghwense]|uniref:Spore germination protein n=1 Tax=Clostridium ganghwense TaxID=312089 RepID=A0ABT4CJ35_9CLOT|nr:spore germination protein [Clostridium ganghwense]